MLHEEVEAHGGHLLNGNAHAAPHCTKLTVGALVCSPLRCSLIPLCPQLVTPIFSFLALEVDKKGTSRQEIGCARLAGAG